jgi:hypothetical protein
MIITTGLFPKYVVKIENGIITKDVFSFFGLFKKKNLSEEINLASVDYIYNAPLPKLIGTKHAVELVGKNATFYIANIPSGVAETIVNEAVKGGANIGEHSYTFIPSKRAMRKFSKGYTMLCDEYGRMIRKIYKKGSNDQEHLDLTDLSYFDDIKENGIKGIAFGKIAGGGNANTIEIFGLKADENEKIHKMVAANSPKLQLTDVNRYTSYFPLFSPSRWFKSREVLIVAKWGILHKQYGVVVNGRKFSTRTSVVEYETIKSYACEGLFAKRLEILGATTINTLEKFPNEAKNAIWTEFKKRQIVNNYGDVYKARLFHRKGQGVIALTPDNVTYRFKKETNLLPYANVYECEFIKPHWYSLQGTITIRGRRVDARAGEGGDIVMQISNMWSWKGKRLRNIVLSRK